MKLYLQSILLIIFLFVNVDLQAVSSNGSQQNPTQILSNQVSKVKKGVRKFTKKVKSKFKKIVKKHESNGIVFGALILLLLVGSLLTFVILQLVGVIAWPWAVVLIPLYILVLLFLYALIPMSATITN